ncbi:HNH endonuclease [Paraliobacillus zengyii]|uniref:HNH endonuclease n=1 Tax=Paraliobacillus zengyii TaxID=2213194 RepID=UPI000DD49E00|nr:HNH endonuclease [Paraliobacillus zengyii]
MNKTCIDCGETKSINLFVIDKSKKDGHRKRCKKCENLRRRKTPVPPVPKEGYKFCADCGKEKSLNEFNIRFNTGKRRPFSYCKPCEHKRDKNKYKHECKKCGKKYSSGKMKSTYCKECHDKFFIKTYSILGTFDWSGKNNPMHGIQRFGKANPNYRPQITTEEREIGRLFEGYGVWRKSVYERDNYTCQCCGDDKGGNLHAHHLDGYNWCKEKRIDIDNGITLCEDCHNKFHKKYGNRNNTKQQFITYVRNKEYLM